jgi:hypothetical protein
MKPYKTHIHSLIVLPEGEPIFSEMATVVGLDDEAAGPFVTLKQYNSREDQLLAINAEEWPTIKAAIDQMIDVCKAIEGDNQ